MTGDTTLPEARFGDTRDHVRYAAKVNAYGPLVRRLRACERIRRHIPNLVAVNFYGRGNLLRAVDTLNGLR